MPQIAGGITCTRKLLPRTGDDGILKRMMGCVATNSSHWIRTAVKP